jgi:hypothetical protein
VIVTQPTDTPVTIPEEEPIVATAGLLLLHVPPGVGSVIVAVSPEHALAGPLIARGAAFTVTIMDVAQPVGSV